MGNDENDLPESIKVGHAQLQKEEKDKNVSVFDKLLSQPSDSFIPWETVQLPSKGIYYNNLMPEGKIEVKAMGIDVDKLIANQRIAQSGEMLNKIVEACVRLPEGFDIYDMLVGDQYFLLYYIRGITHGSLYEFTSECPHCKSRGVYEYDLTELYSTVKYPKEDTEGVYLEEPMMLKLPHLSEKVKKEFSIQDDVYAMIRLIRIKDLIAMTKKLSGSGEVIDPIQVSKARNRSKSASKQRDLSVDEGYLDSMKLQIQEFRIGKEVCGDTKRVALLNKLHQKDTSAIRDFIDEITPGIDTAIEVTCQNKECNKEYNIQLPFGENFFRKNR